MKSDKNSGSRDSDGNVLNANWNDGKFHVNWNNPDNHNDNWRFRQEVSQKKEILRQSGGFLNKKLS